MVFHPNDAQILDLLIKKIKNEKLPRNLVKLGNIYEIDPEKLADNYGKFSTEIWYLFTLRDRKYQNENINVSTVDGYWQVKGDDVNVEYNGETVGFHKIFQFYKGKPGSSKKTSWIMYEFRAIDPLPPQYNVEGRTKLDDWVLCRIWNNKRGYYYENDDIYTSTGMRKTYWSSPRTSYNSRKRKLTST
ncbi:NAC domain-containing protein 68-like [Olea europaea var. sylvestris]|uniref:NAC domain-containing protein 68-like n=1 Tax=Olea europaea var. sylvestris TaxID=158386 RepID=UPI000C1D1D0E|nr:NAC domain-containing protein 68-like [Olea europaea var. sylvestris]